MPWLCRNYGERCTLLHPGWHLLCSLFTGACVPALGWRPIAIAVPLPSMLPCGLAYPRCGGLRRRAPGHRTPRRRLAIASAGQVRDCEVRCSVRVGRRRGGASRSSGGRRLALFANGLNFLGSATTKLSALLHGAIMLPLPGKLCVASLGLPVPSSNDIAARRALASLGGVALRSASRGLVLARTAVPPAVILVSGLAFRVFEFRASWFLCCATSIPSPPSGRAPRPPPSAAWRDGGRTRRVGPLARGTRESSQPLPKTKTARRPPARRPDPAGCRRGLRAHLNGNKFMPLGWGFYEPIGAAQSDERARNDVGPP